MKRRQRRGADKGDEVWTWRAGLWERKYEAVSGNTGYGLGGRDVHPSCRHQGQDPNSNLIIKKRSIGRLYRLYVFTHSQQPYRIAVYLFSHSIHLVYGMELEVTTNHHAAAATASKTLTASEYIQCTGSADE